MAGTLERLIQIQARAAEPETKPHEPGQSRTNTDSRTASAEQKEAIIQSLAAGSGTGALAISLQVIGAGDQAFLDKATRLMRPSMPGEEWRIAYRAYTDLCGKVKAAAAASDPGEAAFTVFRAAVVECTALYNAGSAISRALAVAVYAALEEEYKGAHKEHSNGTKCETHGTCSASRADGRHV